MRSNFVHFRQRRRGRFFQDEGLARQKVLLSTIVFHQVTILKNSSRGMCPIVCPFTVTAHTNLLWMFASSTITPNNYVADIKIPVDSVNAIES